MTVATRRGRLNPRGTSMRMRDDTAEHAHDSAEEECVDETTEETQMSSEARHTNPVIPTADYSNGRGGVARELDSLRVRIERAEDTLRTQSRRVLHFAMSVTPILCALCWHAHRANSVLWDKVNVGIFACTAWLLPSFYCHVFQETDWSRALSCFCVNTFAAIFLYLLSALFVAEQEDMFVLGCVVGIHCILWLGLITMHRMIPRPDGAFDLNNRLLRGQHAQNFINALTPVVIPSILRILLVNYNALFSERDEYTVAFAAVFAVDGLYYTLSLFNTDDPMWALTRQRGSVAVEVFTLQSLMMAMLAKFVWVIGTLFLSDRAKRMWIFVELVVQVVSLIAVTLVSNRYVPDLASGSIRSHAKDMVAKTVVLCSLSYAAWNSH